MSDWLTRKRGQLGGYGVGERHTYVERQTFYVLRAESVKPRCHQSHVKGRVLVCEADPTGHVKLNEKI